MGKINLRSSRFPLIRPTIHYIIEHRHSRVESPAMPNLDIDSWELNSKTRKGDYTPPTIDAEYVDITGREDIDEDSVDLASEPEFPKDAARERDDSNKPAASLNLTFGPLRKIDPRGLNSKWQLVKALTPGLPLNEYDLPTYIYRADMLDHRIIQYSMLNQSPGESGEQSTTPSTIFPPAQAPGSNNNVPDPALQLEAQKMLDAAIVHLDYPEGFPTYQNRPFWQRLDFETENAHDAFVSYLELGAKRTMHDLIAYAADDVLEWFHTYYWQTRVKAFELYRTAFLNKQRVMRMLETEDSHFGQAEKLLKKLGPIFESFTSEELKEVGFAKLVDSFEKLAKVQRISAGLPANGVSSMSDEMKTVPTVQVISQQIVQNSPENREDQAEDLQILDGNTDLIEKAQEFIIEYQSEQDPAK
jgi:hypothetical protein